MDLSGGDDQVAGGVTPVQESAAGRGRRRSARCARALGEAAPPAIRLHDLRHTHATLLLKAGTAVKVVSERLGHASSVVTLGVYAHVMPGMQREAAQAFAALVNGG
jgi:integrase